MSNSGNLVLEKTDSFRPISINIPGSKSESNRVLIIKALIGTMSGITNLATARDTKTLYSLLNNIQVRQNVLDAGTTMRFLTAYYAATNQHKILTGTERMLERPLGILVDALNHIGCDISYLDKVGYPPLEIHGFEGQRANLVSIAADVSSQFISALMMIAPVLPNGLKIRLKGKVGSKPYIEMTTRILSAFGISIQESGGVIEIPNQDFQDTIFAIEPDWSGASYWYAFSSLASEINVTIPGLKQNSLQGDRVIANRMIELGVTTEFDPSGVTLQKTTPKNHISMDFTDNPDLAQTIAVVCAANGIKGTFKGLKSLYIKETDRIAALQKELIKINSVLEQTEHDTYTLIPGINLPQSVTIETYNDHRMAMAFAPLCTKMQVEIINPEVVNKSYPEFWEEVGRSGVKINY